MRTTWAAPRMLAVALAAVGALGCQARTAVAPATPATELATYHRLFPTYARFCAASEIHREGEPAGGVSGHGVLYVRGLVLDTGAPYPRVRLATPAEVSAGTDDVGISVGRYRTTVNWVGIPGAQLFHRGVTYPPADSVDLADVRLTVDTLLGAGVLRGVRGETKQPGEKTARPADSRELAGDMVGTDAAILFARSLECVSIPLSPTMLPAMAEFLNARNAMYAETGRPYRWHLLRNNCTHLAHNAMAATGVFAPLGVDRRGPAELFNVAIPADELAVWLAATDGGPMGEQDDVLAYYRNARWRRLLEEYDWLPHRPGVLAVALRQMPTRDSAFFADTTLWFVRAAPLVHARESRVVDALRDPRATDLQANLTWYAERYRNALRLQRPADSYAEAVGPGAKLETFRAFHDRYYRYVARELAAVEAALASTSSAR
ncbi:MAG TPA: hypothetical protein VHQ45_19540 [Gemmatimonadaceae bacterium]|nr:hypothetical protein [Gemmatimonadaceae bacterium]